MFRPELQGRGALAPRPRGGVSPRPGPVRGRGHLGRGTPRRDGRYDWPREGARRRGAPGPSSRVQAVVDYFGPTDFLQMDAHRPPGGMAHDGLDSPESQLVGGALQENPKKVARANPITYVTAEAPPFLVVHGDRDPIVPHHQSEILVDALREAGVPVIFYTVVGGGHGQFDDPKAPELTKEFLARHLRPPR